MVVGDQVVLTAGDIVPADVRIIESFNLQVDEAILTGETHSVSKTVDSLPENTELAEQVNMAFRAQKLNLAMD